MNPVNKGLVGTLRVGAGLALVAATMSPRPAAAAPANGTVPQPPSPNVLLLLDNSGSMENWTDGSLAPCTTVDSAPCQTASFTNSSGTSVSAQNKWAAVVQALSGSPKVNPSDPPGLFTWYEMKRKLGSAFDNEYKLNNQSVYDVGYSLNYHRIASWDTTHAPSGTWCLLGPGALPGGGQTGIGVGSPTPAFTSDPPDSWSTSFLSQLMPSTIAAANGSVSNAASGPVSDCIFALNGDGNVDAVRDLVRFGLMTFDNQPGPGTGVTASGTALLVQNTGNPSADLWSYFPGWNGTAAPSPGWTYPPEPTTTSDCSTNAYAAAPLAFSQGLASPACAASGQAYSPYEVGARNPAAPPWEGRMVPFPAGSAPLTAQEGTNDQVKMVIAAARPYGATPIAGMLTDARNYFRYDPNGPERSDPYVSSSVNGSHGCRPQYIILLTDGAANLDMRPTCASGGLNNETCPFQPPDTIAKDLCYGGVTAGGTACVSGTYAPVTTFVIGFSFQSFSGPEGPNTTCSSMVNGVTSGNVCTTGSNPCSTMTPAVGSPQEACCNLINIACAGSAGQYPPFFADSASDLNGTFAAILATIARQSSSHVVPVFATAFGNGATYSQEFFTASYKTSNFEVNSSSTVPAGTPTSPWAGTISRTITNCDGSTTPGTFGNATVSPARTFLTVTNPSGPDDTVSLRPFKPSASAATADLFTSTNSAENLAAGAVESLSATTDLKTTDFSCPADPKTGARIGASLCATYASRFYEGLTDSSTLSPTIAGPGGTAYNQMPRQTTWMGPIVNSMPAYVPPPNVALSDNSYRQFADLYRTGGTDARPNALYVESIDGALHALNPDYGTASNTDPIEYWTFLPPADAPLLAGNIPGAAKTLLDGSPIVADTVWSRTSTSASGDWHTTLVSSFGGGGRGYFALDVTQPKRSTSWIAADGTYPTGASYGPHFLWQLTSRSTTTSTAEPFGLNGATPAITTVYATALDGPLAETGVAILPGGSDGLAPTGTCTRILTSDYSPTPTAAAARGYARSWSARTAPAGASTDCINGYAPASGRTVSVVRLSDGAILATFANSKDWTAFGGTTATNHTAPITTFFTAPMVGTPVTYPAGGGRIATSAYVSDADGFIWKLDLSDTNPRNWKASLFFDALNALAINTADPATQGNLSQPLTGAPIISVGPDSSLVLNFATGDQTLFSTKTFKAGSSDTVADEIPVQNFVWSVSDLGGGSTRANWYVPFTDNDYYNDTPGAGPEGTSGPNANSGERVTGPMAVFDGVLYFATLKPADNTSEACALSEARIYGLDYFNPSGSYPGSPGPPVTCGHGGGIGCGGERKLITLGVANPPNQYYVPANDPTNPNASLLAGSLIPGVAITQANACLAPSTPSVDRYFGGSATSYQAVKAPPQATLTYVATSRSSSGASALTNTSATKGTLNISNPVQTAKIDSWAQVIN